MKSTLFPRSHGTPMRLARRLDLRGQSRPVASIGAILLIGLAVNSTQCLADDPEFHSCTVNIGGGFAPVVGTESNTLNAGWNFQAGLGFSVSSNHRWFLTPDFMFDQLGVKQSALEAASVANPTNPAVLAATSGSAKFYSTTLDLTYRIPTKRSFDPYLFAGFGWLRRSIELTGLAGQGSLLEPTNPVVFGSGGNSGAFDAGAGMNFGQIKKLGGMRIYVEARVIHGLAVNKASTLIPISGGIRW